MSTVTAKMIYSIIAVLLLALDWHGAVSSVAAEPSLWPAPQLSRFDADPSILRTIQPDDFSIVYDDPGYSIHVQRILRAAEQRFHVALRKTVPLDAASYSINPQHQTVWELNGARVRVTSDDEALQHGVNEGYSLEVKPPIDNDGFVQLEAATVYGILHGLQTLLQLLAFGWLDDGTAVFTVTGASLHIMDYPHFPYRGLLIDTSRHYLPIDLILRNLDAMAMNKVNVLHWHMVDSQSWPYQSTSFPELSAQGSYCPSCVYTPVDVQRVIQEAADRGIRVIPEFDLPGHSQAVGASHPELLTACDSTYKEPLDVTKDEVYPFVQQLYDEINGTFPDLWIHIGGDEVSLDCWERNQEIQDWKTKHGMKETVEILQYFETKLLAEVDKLGLRPIIWQELFDSGIDIPANVVVDVWQRWHLSTLSEATAQGFTVLLSACWYLDHLNEDFDSFYECNPTSFNGTATQKSRVAGGHASMWGERVDETNFFPRVYPRLSATSEKLWTGESEVAAKTYRARLDRMHCYMIQQGIPVNPLSPGSCARPSSSQASAESDMATS
jgi:hexosaminidase